MSINDTHEELIAFIREKSRIIAPEYPRINDDLMVSEHLWAITSSYEGAELANSDLHIFVNWLIEKFNCNRKDVVDEFHKIHGRLPANADHIFDKYAQAIEKIRMLEQTNKGLMKRLEEECACADALKLKIEILESRMIKIYCRTNIDCAKNLKWPTVLRTRPVVGDLIRSASSTIHKHIELVVVSTTWIEDYLEVELHLPPHRFATIADFERFVKR